MPVRFAILASGSRGNAAIIETAGTRLLVDAGLAVVEIEKRLGALGVPLREISALVITHLHGDHLRDPIVRACAKNNIPIYHHRHTLSAIKKRFPAYSMIEEAGLGKVFDGAPFKIGDIEIEAIPVPHDADGGTSAILANCPSSRGNKCIVVATDFGAVRPQIIRKFATADALIMEFNHDEEMLHNSERARYLKNRVNGTAGHLSNMQAGEALAEILATGDKAPSILVQAHISGECNTPQLARAAAEQAIARNGATGIHLHCAQQDKPSEWFCLSEQTLG